MTKPASNESADRQATLDDLNREWDERFARMNDGTMAEKADKLFQGEWEWDEPPIAGKSY